MTNDDGKHEGEDFSPRSLAKVSSREAAGIVRLAATPTTDHTFAAAFKADPVRTLAAKGIVLKPEEAQRVKQQVAEAIRGGGGLAAETEVTVSVGVKF